MLEMLILTIISFWFIELSHTSISILFVRIMQHPWQFVLSVLFLYLLMNLIYIRFGRRIVYRFTGIFTLVLGLANAFTAKVNDKFFSIADLFLVRGKGDLFVMFIPVFLTPLFFLYVFLLIAFLNLTFYVQTDSLQELYDKNDFFGKVYRRIRFRRKFLLFYEPLIQKRRKTLTSLTLALMFVIPQVIGNNPHFLFSQLLKDMKFVYTYAEPGEVETVFFSQGNNIQRDIGELDRYKDADIVVIQSETFFDVDKLEDVSIHTDVTENFRKYQKEGIHGEVFVPVVGGLTCNSEFEFLTGMKIKRLNRIDVPYEKMPLNQLPSLAWDYAKQGYETIGIHGYYGDFFRRDQVYPLLGIQKFITLPDFDRSDYYGPWIKDEVLFDRILNLLEEDSNKNKFLYAVTVQNHGPFLVTPSDPVVVDGLTENDKTSFTNYVTGLSYSDQALETFMETLRKREKDTIVIFYGDHIIGVNHDLVSEDGYFTKNLNNRYKTDYFVWHNHGKIKPRKVDMSLLALGRLTKHLTMDWSYFDSFVWNHFFLEGDYFGADTEELGREHLLQHKAYETVINALMETEQITYPQIYRKNVNKKD